MLVKIQVLQIGGPDDKALKNVTSMLTLSLIESIYVIKHAKFHIGVDSFSSHATALLPLTSSVILWGSTSPTGSGYAHNINIYKNPLGCSPCYREYDWMSADPKGKCPHDPTQSWETPAHPCMLQITTDEVLDKVNGLLLKTL